jgi:type IV pilus assembly protein PilQ
MTKQRWKFAVPMLMTLVSTALLFGCASQPDSRQSAEPSPPPPLAVIQTVEARHTADGIIVTIAADRPVTFSSLKQPDPQAVTLYFPEATVEQAEVTPVRDIDLIPQIVTRQQNNGRTARIEIQLAGDAAYEAVKEGNGVQVKFKPVAPPVVTAVAQPPAPVQMVSTAGLPTQRPQPSPLDPGVLASAKSDLTTAWINKIEFLNENDGKSTLAVSTTRAVDFRIHKASPNRIEIRLFNTRIPSYHQRPLITTRFNSAVDRIMPTVPDVKKNEAVISVDLREAVPYIAEQSDGLLLVHFEPSAISPRPIELSELPDWKRALIDEQGHVAPGVGVATAGVGVVPPLDDSGKGFQDDRAMMEEAELQSLISPRRRNFSGERIALDFYETDIKNVFRILREVSGKNFAIDKDVTGKVTMTLDKPVPWDQVLDLVLRMNQLGMAQEGDIVRIATQETLKKEEDLRKVKLEAYRKAREEVKALEPLITKYIAVSYSSAATEVKPHIEKILTKDRGSVSVDAKNNQIIINDTAERVRQAEEIVRRIDKVTSQVVIEARVVEVSDTFSRELGLTWSLSSGPGLIGDWIGNTDMAMNLPSQSGSSIGINFSRLSGVPFVLQARLNALETMGEGRILSSPKILTLNNKKAKIKQGLEYPYLERDSSGGSSVKFKNIDLLLEVTPQVTPDNRVSMNIYITKNDVAGITQGVPSVATNEAQTELLVNDGDTIVIGGIIKSSETRGKVAFPGLSKIPVLGYLFQNSTTSKQSNELLIFITPRIVQLEQALAQSSN